MLLQRARAVGAVLLLCLGISLDARVSHAQSASVQASTHAASQRPYGELNPTCPAISKSAGAFGNGVLWALLLGGIPEILVWLFYGRRPAAAALLFLIVVFGTVFVWWNWSFTDCPPHIDIREIDRRVDTDSLYRSWLRFAQETDSAKRRTIARSIHCEATRLAGIARVGEAAVRLTELRVAPPDRFATLAEAAQHAYVAPEPISSYACDTPAGAVSGQLRDADTGKPLTHDPFAVVAISTTHYLRETIAGDRFNFEVVPASADSATIFACADGYETATGRILVGDGSVQTIDLAMRRARVDLSQAPGRVPDPIDVCRKVAARAP